MMIKKFRLSFFFDFLLLFSMLITINISPNLSSIAPWTKISPILFVRSSVWLFGLSILPGLFILRLFKVGRDLSRLTKIAVAINLSLGLVGLASLFLYYIYGSISFFPWFLLLVLVLLGSLYWFKSYNEKSLFRYLSKWDAVLTSVVIISIFIALFVQVSMRYLIAGDLWISLKSAVEIIYRNDLYTAWSQNYPLFFGFILAGLSVSSGFPILNTYVLLFPLVSLNLFSFYALLKEVFKLDEKISVLACIIYCFTGGLGWVLQIILFKNKMLFWTLSYITQDMYFNEFFWYNIEFSYKSLALTMGYASLIMFMMNIKIRSIFEKIIMLTLSSLLILLSFFIHMIEFIIIFPIIFSIIYFYRKGNIRFIYIGLFIFITTILFYIIDFLMTGYYYWLVNYKINNELLIHANKISSYLLLSIGLIVIFILIKRYISIDLFTKHVFNNYFNTIKSIISITLIIFYVSGIYFWFNASLPEIPIYQLNTFPWYYHVTRFGFIGFFALIGFGTSKWNEKWFKIAVFWCLTVLLIGNIWLGSRITCYLTPMISLFAAISLDNIWKYSNLSLHFFHEGGFKLNLKPFIGTLIVLIMILSSSSLIYGANYYISGGASLTDDEAKILQWIHQNIPMNTTLLVPDIYNIKLGVITISDRQIFLYSELVSSISTDSVIEAFILLQGNNVGYAILNEEYSAYDEFIKSLLSYSTLLYHSNNLNVYKFNSFVPNP